MSHDHANGKNTPNASLAWVLAAFAAVYLIWGSTYLGIRIAIETIPPFTMAGVRFLAAGILLYGSVRAAGVGRPTPVQWRSAIIVGTLLLVTGNGLLSWAELYVASGVAALLVATVPLWIVAIDALSGGARPGLSVISGLILGLLGIAILIGPEQFGGARVHTVGAIVICIASFSWALGSIYSRSAPQNDSTLLNVGMQMITGGIILLIGGFALGERVDVEAISTRSAAALVYLTLIGGIVGYSAYVWLLKVSTPARVSTYAFVNPVVAVLLGWAVAGEALGTRVLMATGAVVAAVVLITVAKNRDG